VTLVAAEWLEAELLKVALWPNLQVDGGRGSQVDGGVASLQAYFAKIASRKDWQSYKVIAS
jgi:hypothetical protein